MTISPLQAAKLRELVKELVDAESEFKDYSTTSVGTARWHASSDAKEAAESQLDAYITSLTASAQTGE